MDGFFAVVAPARTPPEIIARLVPALRAAAQWGQHAKAVQSHIDEGCHAMPEALTEAYEAALVAAVASEFDATIVFARDEASAREAARRIVAQAASPTAERGATEIAIVAAGAGRAHRRQSDVCRIRRAKTPKARRLSGHHGPWLRPHGQNL
jgi:hypothetical protein